MLQVSLVLAWAGHCELRQLELAEGACVADALGVAGLVVPGEQWAAVAVHGVLARPDQLLNDADRLEVLRPLLADPKENRRRRARGGL